MKALATAGSRPEFTWRHYLFGSNMIAGVLQTFVVIMVTCIVFTWAFLV